MAWILWMFYMLAQEWNVYKGVYLCEVGAYQIICASKYSL